MNSEKFIVKLEEELKYRYDHCLGSDACSILLAVLNAVHNAKLASQQDDSPDRETLATKLCEVCGGWRRSEDLTVCKKCGDSFRLW